MGLSNEKPPVKSNYLSLDKLQLDKSQQDAFSEKVDPQEIIDIHLNGESRGIPCGFRPVKDIFSWRMGYVYLFSGYPMAGKSQYADYLSIKWVEMDEKNKVAMYSPENYPVRSLQIDLIKTKLKKPIEKKYDGHASREEIIQAKEWLDKKYEFVNFHDVPTIKSILDHWQSLVQEGVNMFILDPLSAIAEGGAMGSGSTLSKYTKHLYTQIKHFAVNNNVIVAIIEHPNRPTLKQDGSIPKCTVHSIYGGANVFNRLDCIVILHRDGTTLEDNEVIIETVKMKRQQLNGQCGEAIAYFDWRYNTYHEVDPNAGPLSSDSSQFPVSQDNIDNFENGRHWSDAD